MKDNIYIYIYIQYCAEVLGTQVFSPQRNGFKPVIYIFCCSVSVGKKKFTFPDINCAINCNNPVKFLNAQGF